MAAELFDAVDRNGDGVIDRAEFSAAMGVPPSRVAAKARGSFVGSPSIQLPPQRAAVLKGGEEGRPKGQREPGFGARGGELMGDHVWEVCPGSRE